MRFMGRKFSGFLISIALLCIAPTAGVKADGFDDSDLTLDQELLSDGHLDVTVAFGFLQKTVLSGDVLGIGNLAQSFAFDRDLTTKVVSDLQRSLLADKTLNFVRTEDHDGDQTYRGWVNRSGHPVPIRVHLIFPTGRESAPRLKAQFIQALGSDDVIVYNGHSRLGAGFPDFDRPGLGSGKVFENSTLGNKWSGFGQHPFNRFKKQVLLLNSCTSKEHYQNLIRIKADEKNADTLALILTNREGYVWDTPKTSFELIRGLGLGQKPEDILTRMNQAATTYHAIRGMVPVGEESDEEVSGDQFSEDGFIKRRVPAPGWPPKAFVPIEPAKLADNDKSAVRAPVSDGHIKNVSDGRSNLETATCDSSVTSCAPKADGAR